MASYSDDEQLEALQRWWNENGRSVIAGVIIGLGALLGWRSWVSYQENRALEASVHYAALHAALRREDAQAIETAAKTLEESFPSTPYAPLAALSLAKVKAEAGDLEAAEAQLRWAAEHSSQEVVRQLARIRLARVLTAREKYDEALAIVNGEFPDAYTSLVQEIRGDVLVALGRVDEARKAYDQAIAAASGDIEYLRMKRADLGKGPAPSS